MLLKKISKNFKNLNLKIIGDGEQKNILNNMIIKKKLTNRIFLLGYKKNIYKYLKKAECFVLTSLWEDPGAVLIEAAALGKNIISSDCNNGPKEILDNGKNGYLFKNNNKRDLIKKFTMFKRTSLNNKNYMSKRLKKKSKFYTIKNHSRLLIKYLNEN
jgi:glycosyltransferase involved in cell wall biosynthesis